MTNVEVRRSARRRRTVSAYRRDGKVIVLIPAAFTRAQEEEWVAKMVARLDRPTGRRAPRSDAALAARAARLSADLFGGQAQPTSVRWVSNQNTRWGSCTPSTGAIRGFVPGQHTAAGISARLVSALSMP